MNRRELLLDRCRASSRVRRLEASAIVSGVDIHCGQRLDTNVAYTLATRLTPIEAVERFLAQATVPRRNMTGKQLEIYRAFVVTKEAIEAGEYKDPEQDRGRELLDKLWSGYKLISRELETKSELEQIGVSLENSGPARRRFYRRADRLWKQQLNSLKAAIYDSVHYEDALSDLEAVYVRAFREAMELDDLS